MEFDKQQLDAMDRVARWLREKDQPVFRLFGYAGSGKTTLAKYMVEQLEGSVFFCAFTGKAAKVLQDKGCRGATTIHKLIYLPKDKSKRRLQELQEARAKTKDNTRESDRLDRDILFEQENLKRPMFQLNAESSLKEASLIVVDEASMVDDVVGNDLLSFGVPVLALGDPAQLPPVRGSGYFVKEKPDIMLTSIHRQAAENPIIRMATMVREGKGLPLGSYGDSVVRSGKPLIEEALGADQMIVGRNAARTYCNARMRKLLERPEDPFPRPGDKLVCLRNDHDEGLLNGGLWEVKESEEPVLDMVQMTIQEDGADFPILVNSWTHHFEGRGTELDWWTRKQAQEFDYGYALTCHKSQGSQWNNVLIYDESRCFRQDARKWLYTAVTRAAEKVTIFR